mgnify:CR=1 FL=1
MTCADFMRSFVKTTEGCTTLDCSQAATDSLGFSPSGFWDLDNPAFNLMTLPGHPRATPSAPVGMPMPTTPSPTATMPTACCRRWSRGRMCFPTPTRTPPACLTL